MTEPQPPTELPAAPPGEAIDPSAGPEPERIPAAAPPKRRPYNQWSPDARALNIMGDKWTLLIIRDLASGPRRYIELERTLPGISNEQLRLRVGRMVEAGLLTRRRYREVPPRVEYELTEQGRALLPVVGALARWGFRWAWSQPEEIEAIDIGAILRITPGLLKPQPGLRGSAELTVRLDAMTSRCYTLTMTDHAVQISERGDADARTRIAGSRADWIDALGPTYDRRGLVVEGDAGLAARLLDAISDVA